MNNFNNNSYPQQGAPVPPPVPQQQPVYRAPQPTQPAQPMPASTPYTKNAPNGAPNIPKPPQQQPLYPPYPQYPAYQPAYGLPQKKQYQPFSKKENIFAALFFVASFLFVDFALFQGFHLGFTIVYAVIFVLATAFLLNKNAKQKMFPIICGALSLTGAVTFALYCNPFINFIMFVLVCGLFTIYCLGISGSFERKQGNFKMLFDLGMGAAIHPFANLGDVFGSLRAGMVKRKRNISAILGVVLALPVLVILVTLLIKSDAAFEGMVQTIAKNIGLYLLELVVAAVLLPFLFSYMYGKRKDLNRKGGQPKEIKRGIPISGCVSFLCMISITYLIYLFSQLAYFFSAFKGFLPEGYTRSASEFARRGFFEMFAICAINVAIIAFIGAFSKRNAKGKTATAIKVMSLFISLFSVLLIATAMQKMKLNITTYGFTRNRLLVSVFMLMMLVVIAFFILHIFAPKISYMQPIIVICSCMFIALSFANIDDITFNYNMKAYQNGTLKSLDMYTISTLEPEQKYYIELMKGDDEKLAHDAQMRLIETFSYADDLVEVTENAITMEKTDFREYCKAREDARQSVKDYYYSLGDKEKAAFYDTYNKLSGDYYYDREEDCIYDYEHDKKYAYNPQTGMFDKEEKITYEDWE